MKAACLAIASAFALALVTVPSGGALAQAKPKAKKVEKVEYLRAAVATPTPAATTSGKARRAKKPAG
jgi:hypothetical protein